MIQFLRLLKDHLYKTIAFSIGVFLIGMFTTTIAIPNEMKEMKKRQDDLENNQMALALQVQFNQKEIMRLTQENIKDSLAQKYIIETLKDIKEGVKDQNSKLDRLQEGYWHRYPRQ